MRKDLDDEYHEYLWGERSPRTFALKAKLGTKAVPRNVMRIEVDAALRASDHVPR